MAASTTFSLFFPLPNKHQQWPDCDDHSSITNTSPSSSTTTASVDCTLSLWTPSSRRAAAEPAVEVTNNKHVPKVAAADHHHQASSYYCRQSQGQGGKAKACASPHDAFADRRCANCGTSSTPLWRNGPRGPKSLCNACGIRFKKEERRAAAMEAGCGYIAQYEYGEAAFPCGGPGDADAPFLAWRLNVVASAPAFAAVWPERTTLFQYN